MHNAQINYFAVLAAALSTFLIAGLRYSPVLFGKVWQREVGLSDIQLANGNKAKTFGSAFLLSLIAAFVFALFLGPRPPLALGWEPAFRTGCRWVASSFGIDYLFAR